MLCLTRCRQFGRCYKEVPRETYGEGCRHPPRLLPVSHSGRLLLSACNSIVLGCAPLRAGHSRAALRLCLGGCAKHSRCICSTRLSDEPQLHGWCVCSAAACWLIAASGQRHFCGDALSSMDPCVLLHAAACVCAPLLCVAHALPQQVL